MYKKGKKQRQDLNPSQSDSRTLHVIPAQEPFLSLPLVLTRDHDGRQHSTQQRLTPGGKTVVCTYNDMGQPQRALPSQPLLLSRCQPEGKYAE